MAISDDFICVIDGSTSKTPRRHHPTLSNGRYCMTLISEVVKSMPADTSMEVFCDMITAKIRSAYADDDLPRLKEHPEERLTASCIVYSRLRREIWMVGDCQCLMDGTLYENPKPYELSHAEKRIGVLETLIAQGHSVDDLCADDLGRTAVVQDIIDSMQMQNVTYSVADGFPILMAKVVKINITHGPMDIVFASDGYPFVLPTLKESEEALDCQRRNDPLNMHTFKATKAFIPGNNSFDDRTYVRFSVQGGTQG